MKTNALKILAVLGVLALVLGVYLIKNNAEEKTATITAENKEEDKTTEIVDTEKPATEAATETETQGPQNTEATEETEQAPSTGTDADFALYADDSIDLENLKNHQLPIILVFGSEDCIYCVQMKPDLEVLNEEEKGKAIIKYVDMAAAPKFFSQWPIQGTPALMYINAAGEPYTPSEKYQDLMYLYTYQNSEEHALTMSYGKLEKENLKEILAEME